MKNLIKALKYRAHDRLYRWRAESFLTTRWNKYWISAYVRNIEGKIVLTYNADASHEGAGAQLQRMYGIYALSRFLSVPYRHTPLRHVAYQGLSALQENVIDPDYVDMLNRVFYIDSDRRASDDLETVTANTLSPKLITQLASQSQSKPFVLALNTPFKFMEHVPDCWHACKIVSPFSSNRTGLFRVAVHVRWGDVLIADSWRLLPNNFYIQVALRIANILQGLKIPYQIELHTEVPIKESIVAPEHHHTFKLNRPTKVSPEMCRLHEFDVLPNFVRRINEDTITTLRQLATADALVLSRSSFSFLAGILNKRGIVLYHPFWHACPSSWLVVKPNGRFDDAKFLNQFSGINCGGIVHSEV